MDSFFSAEELFQKISKKHPSIGISTVYRFLKDEKKKGNIFSYLCDRKTVYSLGRKSHCHFFCEKTGKTLHFDIDDINFLKNKVPGKIKSIQLEVRGVCDACSK